MTIGILSDSHGRVETTASAVRLLRDAGAELLLHLGDIGSSRVLDELVGHPARVVFGNCDLDERELRAHAEAMGIEVDHPAGELTWRGRRIVFTHGHLGTVVREALASEPEYLLVGHTHQVLDERMGSTRVLNPGALHRASRYTAAVLRPELDEFRVLEVPRTASSHDRSRL